MLRWRTDSENDSAPGGPVSNPRVCVCACEISTTNPTVGYSMRAKSRAFVPTWTFAIVITFKTLQHGVCSSPLLAGDCGAGAPWQCIGATEVFGPLAVTVANAQ